MANAASDWASGYIVDIAYTSGYYTELNPNRVKLAFINAGLAAPEVAAACELGFGHGLTANIHAAASGVQWWGTDFNPAQVGLAQELARVSRADARLYDEAFADFCSRPDLPDFDYIGLHGIWSWISKENCSVIVDFVRRKLKVGGVLYISYNTMPGWAAMAPMRHLLTEHAEVMEASGRSSVSRIGAAIEFAERVLAVNPGYARANPLMAGRVKALKELNQAYVAHEYLCRDWHPMPFAEMAESLSSAKLNYACSAQYLDHVDAINLSAEQQAFLAEIPDAMFRETVRDYMVNQQFRRDYWVKGARKTSPLSQAEALRKQLFVLTEHRPDVALKVTGALGEANLQEKIYGPLLDVLADHQPKSFSHIEQTLSSKSISSSQLLQAVMILIGSGAVQLAQDSAIALRAKPHTDRLNAHLIDKARGSGDIAFLASPVTGGGVVVPRFAQLFLLARAQGKKHPQEWAEFCWQVLQDQGLKVVLDGKRLETPEQNIAHLVQQADEYAQKRLPILRALGIA